MKKINLILLLFIELLLSNCSKRNEVTQKWELSEFADSLFQTSVDSSIIAGANVLVYKNGKNYLIKLMDMLL